MRFCVFAQQSKLIVVAALVAGVSSFAPSMPFVRQSTAVFQHGEKGAGGMFDTRNPEPLKHEDKRKSISEAPSFEEYMKMRAGGGAPAPAAPAPAPAAWSPPAAPAAWAPPAPAAPAAWSPPASSSPPAWAPPASSAPPAWAPPSPAPAAHGGHGGAPVKGAGGMFDTRDPAPIQHEDKRKSISAAPSFEEYMKMRNQQ